MALVSDWKETPKAWQYDSHDFEISFFYQIGYQVWEHDMISTVIAAKMYHTVVVTTRSHLQSK